MLLGEGINIPQPTSSINTFLNTLNVSQLLKTLKPGNENKTFDKKIRLAKVQNHETDK